MVDQFRASPEPDRALLRLGWVFPVDDVVVGWGSGFAWPSAIASEAAAGHCLAIPPLAAGDERSRTGHECSRSRQIAKWDQRKGFMQRPLFIDALPDRLVSHGAAEAGHSKKQS